MLIVPLIVAGLCLRLTHGWFAGQHTVGTVCLVVGIVLLAIRLLIAAGLVAGASRRW